MTLVAWLISSTTAGYLVTQILVNNGGSIPISPWNIIVTLPLIGIILLAMAIPMFKYRRALAQQKLQKSFERPKRLNPFYAVRLVLLSKSIAIAGAIFSGWHLGVVWLQITSPIIPSSVLQNALALIGSVFMTIAAIIVERICRIDEDGNTEVEQATKLRGGSARGATNGEPA